MKTILTIEGNVAYQDNLVECLEMAGYRAIGAANGQIGVQLAKVFTPDLIICNLLLPVLGGLEVLSLIVTNPATSAIPFIFSTTQSEPCTCSNAIQLGADSYLIKPYNIESLLSAIENLLQSGSKRVKERYLFDAFC